MERISSGFGGLATGPFGSISKKSWRGFGIGGSGTEG
eukprot:CAMPEP_0180328534 /NCGR_PEP_ID=MMETSP0988-20121125/40255_1 /TAXON_ID=697907 /ORGANISM="non described non described, Strain CCMP2293" /LENGTH=36 /DNA_ID= /DNA_START= /DNA_END= /DNA_ORIENTATION=